MKKFVWLKSHATILIERILNDRDDFDILMLLPISVEEVNNFSPLLHKLLWSLIVIAS